MNSSTMLMYLVVLIVIVGLVSAVAKSIRSSKDDVRPGQGAGSGAGGGADGPARQPTANAERVVEDIRMTQTSRIADAVSVLEDLDRVHPGYRQYAELVGTTQGSSTVTAPYSKRAVAYYDLRAFRVENRGGRDVETLVAHERSIEPFWFTDGSCDTKVYVDLDSFGDDIILVNSANRIEGPGSDFARAMDGAGAGSGTAGAGGSARPVTAAVGRLRDAARGLLAGARERLRGWRDRLVPAPVLVPAPALAPAFAGAAGMCGGVAALPLQRAEGFLAAPAARHDARENLACDGDFGFDFGDFDGLGDFLGPDYDPGYIGGPRGDYWGGIPHGSGASEVLLGMGLGALVGQIANNMADDGPAPQQAQFRGYRIVEDVVPLNQPVYVLGELYKNGPAYTIGRSVSESYPSSFFATKPEAEVVAHLKNQ